MRAPGDTFGPNTEQFRWLVQDLESVDREETPWLIVNFHAPWYNSYNSHFKVSRGNASYFKSNMKLPALQRREHGTLRRACRCKQQIPFTFLVEDADCFALSI